MSLFGGSSKSTAPVTPETALRVQTALAGMPIPIGWGQNRIAPNLIWYGDFKSTAVQQSGGGGKGLLGGGGGKGQSGTSSYTYSAAVQLAIGEGPIAAIGQVWNGKSLSSLATLNLTTFLGSYTQVAWSYLTTKHPSQALGYRGLAHLDSGPMNLGNSPTLPNLGIEVKWAINSATGLGPDADPRDVLVDFLTNPHYGLNFPAARIGDLSVWSAYCRANGLVVSPLLTSAVTASTFIDDLMIATNSELVWSGGMLNVVPYGDQAITANGATYTPNLTPQYSFSDNDMFPNQGSSGNISSSDPVVGSRSDQAQTWNHFKIGFLDRANSYNPDIAEAIDEASVNATGRRFDTVKTLSNVFALRSAAQMSADLMLGRQAHRNQGTITVGPEYILLDPMDINAVNDTLLGMTNQLIRVTEITRNSDRTLTLAYEEFGYGAGSAPAHSTEPNAGYQPNYASDPGNANAPFIFDAAFQLANGQTQPEVWLATSGGANWGGCQVFISSDNTTFTRAVDIFGNNELRGPSRMGVLTGTFGSGSDPDTTNTLVVDLTQSFGALIAGTTADADSQNTLCWVDGEYVSYSAATLTSQYNYSLGTYLRRGQNGSQVSSHAIGASFIRLDSNVFRIPYSAGNVGQTIYVKLVSFNQVGGGLQDISTVTSYPHTIGGPPTVYSPSSLVATAGLKNITLTWANAANVGQKSIQIWRSASSAFGSATHIGDAPANATLFVDSNVSSNTQYWYWIRAVDNAGGTSSYTPSTGGAGATATTGQTATGDIQDNAVSNASTVSQVGTMSSLSPNGTYEDIITLTITVGTNGTVLVGWTPGTNTFTGGNSGGGSVGLYRDSTEITPALNRNNMLTSGLNVIDVPGAGSHTYKLRGVQTSGTATAQQWSGWGLTVTNIMK